ncbi:hypothetical protein PENTCL1PPCAC_9432 [Pristionchus entomophagus]|uniref:Tetraspanin n=1 Tax=Pristionchus entomophagus TaxID=358040 RepID=A0AAV5SY17_9BILA|nr:hypothetical protein PENTCL1PPCAC_9432 [Pristionchus entomophagus]
MGLLDRLSYASARKWLMLLNGGYLILAVILIATGWYTHNAAIVTSVSIAGGIIAAGVFLSAVAVLGIYGTREQNQAALFFYMIILFLVFVVQCSVALACLGEVSLISLDELISAGWKAASPETVFDAEKAFGCCGLRNASETTSECTKLDCFNHGGCPPCLGTIVNTVSDNLSRIGWIGLLFSFTELAGIALAHRFRNTKNPRFNPNLLFQ